MGYLKISSNIKIPKSELEFHFSRSSGPGGQHVNKSNTKVLLTWSLAENRSLSERTKNLLFNNLEPQLTTDGRIVISSDRYRSQDRNREDCLEKFLRLIKKGTFVPKKRKKTQPTKASKAKRLKDKKTRSELKKLRKKDF